MNKKHQFELLPGLKVRVGDVMYRIVLQYQTRKNCGVVLRRRVIFAPRRSWRILSCRFPKTAGYLLQPVHLTGSLKK